MKHPISKVWAFLKRDFLIESSYKLSFVLDIFRSLFPVFSFYFIAMLIDGAGNGERSGDLPGGSYFPFVLIGVSFTQYLTTALSTFANTVRRAQTAGVLEAMLSTQTSPQEVVLYTAAYSFLSATSHVLIVLAAGGLLLGVDFGRADFVSAVVVMVLTIASFSGLGILSATLILLLKKGDPVELLIGSTASLLGGAFFPVDLLPEALQLASSALPITYALNAMRLALFEGSSVVELAGTLGILAGITLVLFPFSLWAFSKAVDKSRRDGTLIHY